MSVRCRVRAVFFAIFLVGAVVTGASCYRVEVDLTPLIDESQAGGGVLLSAAGGSAMGGASAEAGAGEAGACEPVTEDNVQHACRIRLPSQQVCDEQEHFGWPGCYAGGCSVCTEVLDTYPYYLARHPCCVPNYTCSVHSPIKCSPLCPPPSELDKVMPCFNLAR